MCLARRIRSCSGSLCSLLWVPAEAFDALGQLLDFLCMLLAGRHEVKENCGGPFVQQSEHWRFSWPCSPLSGVGLVKAMATLQRWLFTASCLSPKANMNWAFFGVTFAQSIIPLFPSYAVSTRFLQKPTQQPKKDDRIIGPIGPCPPSPASSWLFLPGLP